MKRHIAAGFQEAIVDVLTEKAMWAVEATGVKILFAPEELPAIRG